MAEQKQVKLKLPEDLQPVFSNMIRVGHTPAEFTLDFFKLLPAMESMNVDVRVVMTPIGAKMLLQVLTENIQHYEKPLAKSTCHPCRIPWLMTFSIQAVFHRRKISSLWML